MRSRILVPAILLLSSCSRLQPLTAEVLDHAEAQWEASKPSAYKLVIEIEGDRVKKEQFQVHVEMGVMTSLQRNGQPIKIVSGQDYSMNGLFRTLHEEMDLAQTPQKLGAEAGYSAYMMAKFDGSTGRLIEYQRSVGGISNSIHIRVISFSPA